MGNAGEPLGRAAPHALGGTFWDDKLRMDCLQIHQFAIQPVIDRVLHFRSIQHVVGVGCPREQPPELCSAFAILIVSGLWHSCGHRTSNSAFNGGDPFDFPGVFDLGEGEVERHLLLVLSDQLDGENHASLLQPGPT